jgi:hypothetical protein
LIDGKQIYRYVNDKIQHHGAFNKKKIDWCKASVKVYTSLLN